MDNSETLYEESQDQFHEGLGGTVFLDAQVSFAVAMHVAPNEASHRF